MFSMSDIHKMKCPSCENTAYLGEFELDDLYSEKLYGIIRCSDKNCGCIKVVEGSVPKEIVGEICPECHKEKRVTCTRCIGRGFIRNDELRRLSSFSAEEKCKIFDKIYNECHEQNEGISKVSSHHLWEELMDLMLSPAWQK